jgi:hypothetical protein
MEVTRFSETSVPIRITLVYVPEHFPFVQIIQPVQCESVLIEDHYIMGTAPPYTRVTFLSQVPALSTNRDRRSGISH